MTYHCDSLRYPYAIRRQALEHQGMERGDETRTRSINLGKGEDLICRVARRVTEDIQPRVQPYFIADDRFCDDPVNDLLSRRRRPQIVVPSSGSHELSQQPKR